MHCLRVPALAGSLVLAACAASPARDAVRTPWQPTSDRLQRAEADAPQSLQGSTALTHDANFDSLDAQHACFTVTLRAVAGESRALHAIDQWHPRLRIDGRGREVELGDARVAVQANERADVAASQSDRVRDD